MPLRPLPPALLKRATTPAIIPIPAVFTGNNVPFSLKKTRRTWSPNCRRVNLPVNVLGGASNVTPPPGTEGTRKFRYPEIKGVRIQMRHMRKLPKAGGIEGLLLATPSKRFTPFGQSLRAELFDRLHRLRDQLEDGSGAISKRAGVQAIGTGSAKAIGATKAAKAIEAPTQ